MQGSGLFSGYAALKPHLLVGPGGHAAEIEELATALQTALAPLAAVAIEEWVTPAAASTTAIMHATATVNGPVTYKWQAGAVGTGFLVTPATFAAAARNVTITGGGTTGQCPTSAALVGFDAAGNPQTETIALTAGSGTGVKGWSKVQSIAFTGGTGTAGTEAVGFGIAIGLMNAPKARTGQTATAVVPWWPELEDGSLITTNLGTIDATNHTFTPHDAPNATHDWVLTYEIVGK